MKKIHRTIQGYAYMFAVYSSTAVDASLEEKYQARIDPRRECKHADMAHGTAAMGPKCWVASMAPRAEFCMPTSIELVRAAFSGTPIVYLLTVYPRKKPPAWRAKIPATSLTPAAMTATLFDAITRPQMHATNNTADTVLYGVIFETMRGKS